MKRLCAILAAALVAASGSDAVAAEITKRPTATAVFTLDGSHGYKLLLGAASSRADGKGELEVLIAKPGRSVRAPGVLDLEAIKNVPGKRTRLEAGSGSGEAR